ncbi:MAG TPA: class I SAM-dependent methyltransferase [Pyrinomonadaceae bacterium]
MQRNALTLFIKAILCVAASFTLLGASLAFQQPKPARDRSKPAAASSPPQIAPPQESDKLDRPTSDPYKGSLSIFEDAKRDEKLQINRVMDILRIGEGSRVADIGAGSGWFTVRAARRVGAKGVVYAVEINREYLRHIEERATREQLANISAVLGKEDDPLLPEAGVDAVLILKTYHEIAQPVRLMRNLRRSLAPGALVGVIDRNGTGDDHGLDDRKVISEAGRAGFALVAQYDFVKPDGMDYFLVFRARD